MLKQVTQRLSVIGVSIGVATLAFSTSAFAHVVVKPAEVVTAGFQTFTIGVPNEKDISTTSIKLVIPDGLKYVQPTQKAGWQIDVEKSGTGEDAAVKSITWSGNEVKGGFRDDFTFSGQVPEKAADLQWKAYQTYSDGTVVSWDKAAQGEDSETTTSGPFSVTKVVADTATDTSIKKADQAAADAKSEASTALYVGVAGIVVGLAGVYVATRNK
ncbi:MAG: YcnI family protein [Candidatus Saccharimonadales bacterium]